MSDAALNEFLDWFEQWVAALNSYDVDALLELVAEEIEWSDPAMLGERACGREQFRRFVEASLQAFPDIRFVAVGAPFTASDGGAFAVRWRIAATFTGKMEGAGLPGARGPTFAPTGRQVDSEGIDVYELQDGRLRRWSVFYDLFDVSVQAGLAPRPDSRLVRAAAAAQRLLARVTAAGP